jgi:hypothetical protein
VTRPDGGQRGGMLIALLAVLGVDLSVIVALMVVVLAAYALSAALICLASSSALASISLETYLFSALMLAAI